MMLSTIGDWLFDTSTLTPHGFCLVWEPGLIWTYALSDATIALAYFSIPAVLVFVARKRKDLVFRPLLWLFAAFIVLCGMTHWFDLATLWVPIYGLQAVIKAATAITSLFTAAALWWLLPQLLSLPSPEQLRQTSAALVASQEQLAQAQKMEAVGQLTGGIAHDFNNLLQVISGSLLMLERRIEQGRAQETGRYVSAIRQASDTAARLTNRLLAFSRRQALKPQPTDVDALVANMDEMLRRTLGPEITLQVSASEGRWEAVCDPTQLESVILNLCINARDAMPAGGTLRIACSNRVLAAAEVAGREVEPGNFIELDITDTGEGMSAEVLARAFEPFFTTKPTGQGTGLGLSQVYGFVRQSGGFVQLDSTPGKGTTVRLFLPGHDRALSERVQRSAAMPADAIQIGAESLIECRIMLVEDVGPLREQLREALGALSSRISEHADAASALSQLQAGEAVDILITDIGLPGMDGRQLAEAARRLRGDLPVLLITGYAGRSPESLNLGPGMELLRKPFSLDELVARVRILLVGAAERQVNPAA